MNNVKTAKYCLEELLKKCKQQEVSWWRITAVKRFEKNLRFSSRKICSKFLLLLSILLWCYCWKYINQGECLVEMPSELSKAFRPPEKCEFCKGITEMQRIANISPMEFEIEYAYSGKPIIVTDAAQNWTALKDFDFWYFKDVYMNAKRKGKTLSCQFFPYKTGFKNLFEALNIPPNRVNYEPGTDPWYFGWSNCNVEVAEVLRQHYGRPYFLPETSENNAVDWIFIGGPGLGVHMHVDNVRLPSWQAQLHGAKQWILAPPPECYFHCNSFSTVVQTGEIIVLDTNRWYHQTIVAPGEISITIGAEYD